MAEALSAIDFLAKPPAGDVPAVCAVFGDETFLKRLVLDELRRVVLGDEDGEFSLARFDGAKAQPREVFDELGTVALFGGRRLVVVDDADEFVTRHRPLLEDYVARATAGGGVLVLDAKSWAKTTRLYKALAQSGWQIECKTPSAAALARWLVGWAKKTHQTKLDPDAAELLIELAGPELGLLDQELAKLAVSVGPGGTATPDLVSELVGGWRAKTGWDMIDAAVAGDARNALMQLDRLISAGEHPIALLGQMAFSLRKFAAAARIVERTEAAGRRTTLRQALEQAGIKAFLLNKAEPQLKQVGRRRAVQLYRWLLETDLDMKGFSNLPPRTVLERLIVRLSAAAAPPAGAR